MNGTWGGGAPPPRLLENRGGGVRRDGAPNPTRLRAVSRLRRAVAHRPALVEAVVERVERAVDATVGEARVDDRQSDPTQRLVRKREEVVHVERVVEDALGNREGTLHAIEPAGAERRRQGVVPQARRVRAEVRESDAQAEREGLPGK